MTTATLAGTTIDLDAEGFLADPAQWNEEIAAEIARDAGIPELTPRHWQVVSYMRTTYLETGQAPSIRSLGKQSGVPDQGAVHRCSPKGPPSSPRRSAASRSHAAASREEETMTITDHDLAELTRPAGRRSPRRSRRSRSWSRRARSRAIYPGLIMANGARMEGIEANVFFTFFGLDAITRSARRTSRSRRSATPACTSPTHPRRDPGHVLGRHEDDGAQDGEARHPAGAGVRRADRRLGRRHLRAARRRSTCSASRDEDFVPQVTVVLTVGEFYELAAGGEIVFT